jgi:hypothetical protein
MPRGQEDEIVFAENSGEETVQEGPAEDLIVRLKEESAWDHVLLVHSEPPFTVYRYTYTNKPET